MILNVESRSLTSVLLFILRERLLGSGLYRSSGLAPDATSAMVFSQRCHVREPERHSVDSKAPFRPPLYTEFTRNIITCSGLFCHASNTPLLDLRFRICILISFTFYIQWLTVVQLDADVILLRSCSICPSHVHEICSSQFIPRGLLRLNTTCGCW